MTTTQSNDISAISLKLPPFWIQQPRIWFAQAESQFETKRILAENVKYHYTVAALDQAVALRVLDLIENPPEDDKYTALKNRLIQTFALSEYERAGNILHIDDLGDRKPSELMDVMLGHLGNEAPCFLFRRIFLERLPEHIRAPLMNMQNADPRELAKTADTLWEANQSITYAIHNRKTKSRNYVPRNSALCYYHDVYGAKAHKCVSPCKMSNVPLAGNAKANLQ